MKLLMIALVSTSLCVGVMAETPADAPVAKSAQETSAVTKEKAEQATPAKSDEKQGEAKSNGEFTTLAQRAGYALGLSIGQNIKEQHISVDLASMNKGMEDGLSGRVSKMTNQEIQLAMAELQEEIQKKQTELAAVAGVKNKADGEAFLAQNKTKEGVVTTASGLQYQVLTPGNGNHPKSTDVVTVQYVGKLLDGTEFDSSYKRNQPASFPVNGVIPGWTEALQLMKPGAKYRLFIPSKLAYGESGAGDVIGPNAVLVFEVELLSVKPGT